MTHSKAHHSRETDTAGEIQEAAAEKVKEAKNFVVAHPYKTAAIAFGLLTLIGWALRKKSI